MKEMGKREHARFQKDLGYALNVARVLVHRKYDFSISEISKLTGMTEKAVEEICNTFQIKEVYR